jgi:hypothetical protein
MNRDQSKSQSRSAGHREFNFGCCLLKGAPSLGSSSDASESSCKLLCSFLFQHPWPNGLPEQFPPHPLAGTLQQSFQGAPLPDPPCKLICCPRSQTPVAASRLDLLWLANQPTCDRLYPPRDPSPSSPAC